MIVPGLSWVACFISIEWPAALTFMGLPPRYVIAPLSVTTMAMPSLILGVIDWADAAVANASERPAAMSVDLSNDMSPLLCGSVSEQSDAIRCRDERTECSRHGSGFIISFPNELDSNPLSRRS